MRHHISTSIDGLLALTDYRLKKMAPFFTVDGVQLRTAGQVKKELRKEKALGHLYIQTQGCVNFDPVKGCLGCPCEKGEDDQ